MRLSVLDQSPISSDQTAEEALRASVMLAQEAERLGYTRYWIAEHHDLPGLACSAPEVMLSYIGSQTSKLRIGSGAVLLPHYKPYKVAEVYNMLATLFPGRIDVGVGRAPGGSAEASQALSGNFLQNVWKLPELLDELLSFLKNDFPIDHEYYKLSASPLPAIPPEPWLLGTSEKSAILAAEKGLRYNFGQFMSDGNGKDVIETYVAAFKPSKINEAPEVIVTLSVVCAETIEKAQEIASSTLVWGIQNEKGEGGHGIPSIQEAANYPLSDKEIEKIDAQKKRMIIGSPLEVKERLLALQAEYRADEMMIHTNTYRLMDRIQSYGLIAKEFSK